MSYNTRLEEKIDAAARRWGRLGLIASDLTAALGEVWTAWGR